jgi:hypothetical protein
MLRVVLGNASHQLSLIRGIGQIKHITLSSCVFFICLQIPTSHRFTISSRPSLSVLVAAVLVRWYFLGTRSTCGYEVPQLECIYVNKTWIYSTIQVPVHVHLEITGVPLVPVVLVICVMHTEYKNKHACILVLRLPVLVESTCTCTCTSSSHKIHPTKNKNIFEHRHDFLITNTVQVRVPPNDFTKNFPTIYFEEWFTLILIRFFGL